MEELESLVEFIKRFGTERACLKALIANRWLEGFCCSKCGDRRGVFAEKMKNIRMCRLRLSSFSHCRHRVP